MTVKCDFFYSADITAVWKYLTEDLTLWWDKDHFSNPLSTKMILELFPGGRMLETDENGNGILWYNVISVEYLKQIDLHGTLFPKFGGPAHSFMSLAFTKLPQGTTLEITDIYTGNLDDRMREGIADGWKSIFDVAFRKYIENKNNRYES